MLLTCCHCFNYGYAVVVDIVLITSVLMYRLFSENCGYHVNQLECNFYLLLYYSSVCILWHKKNFKKTNQKS